jgi:hypothetical protein
MDLDLPHRCGTVPKNIKITLEGETICRPHKKLKEPTKVPSCLWQLMTFSPELVFGWLSMTTIWRVQVFNFWAMRIFDSWFLFFFKICTSNDAELTVVRFVISKDNKNLAWCPDPPALSLVLHLPCPILQFLTLKKAVYSTVYSTLLAGVDVFNCMQFFLPRHSSHIRFIWNYCPCKCYAAEKYYRLKTLN